MNWNKPIKLELNKRPIPIILFKNRKKLTFKTCAYIHPVSLRKDWDCGKRGYVIDLTNFSTEEIYIPASVACLQRISNISLLAHCKFKLRP